MEAFMMFKSFLRMGAVLAAILALGSWGFGQRDAQTKIFGGPGGNSFTDQGIPSDAQVTEVRISAAKFVDSVQLTYVLPDGRTFTSPRRGGSGGELSVFSLDPDEYITGLSGRCGTYIDSLRIYTNKRTSPLYGGIGGGPEFRIETPRGRQAVGFTGRSGKYLDAIGLVTAPIYTRPAWQPPRQMPDRQTAAAQTAMAGGNGGNPFMDERPDQDARITEIRVFAGIFIDGIQAVYALPNGRLFEGAVHGNRGGAPNVFRLERDEYVIGLSGRCGQYVDSLQIMTNRRTSPRYGGAGGKRDYRVEVDSGYQAIGFFGRSGKYLDAIGLTYIEASRQGRDRWRDDQDRDRRRRFGQD
jgi:hypothetical protein